MSHYKCQKTEKLPKLVCLTSSIRVCRKIKECTGQLEDSLVFDFWTFGKESLCKFLIYYKLIHQIYKKWILKLYATTSHQTKSPFFKNVLDKMYVVIQKFAKTALPHSWELMGLFFCKFLDDYLLWSKFLKKRTLVLRLSPFSINWNFKMLRCVKALQSFTLNFNYATVQTVQTCALSFRVVHIAKSLMIHLLPPDPLILTTKSLPSIFFFSF